MPCEHEGRAAAVPVATPAARRLRADRDGSAHLEPTLRSPSPFPGAPLPRLPYSRAEAEAVAALAPPGQTLQALGFSANTELVESGRLGRYSILHFATHERMGPRRIIANHPS